jgi:DNA-binding CsgD family transcriptional regulator
MRSSTVSSIEQRRVAYLEARAAREFMRSPTARFDVRSYREILESHATPRPLTPRQMILLELVSGGLRDREIADRMGISPHTVNNAIRRLKTRLRVNHRSELADVAPAILCRRFLQEPMADRQPEVDEAPKP